MKVWRISKRRHAATAFSGEGARLVAGRWNPVGTPMVYASASLSLAALEVFVHLEGGEEPDSVSIGAELPVDAAQMKVDGQELLRKLPSSWREVASPIARHIGADWIMQSRSLAVMVPSVVIDGEWNLLINPAHHDFSKIRFEEPRPFRFDPRMFSRRG